MNLDRRLYFSIPHKNPTPIQRKAIPAILEHQNIIGIARTGSGKTLAYLIPVVQKVISGQKALIIVPTRDLVYQVANFLRTLTRDLKVKTLLVHGEKEIAAGSYDIIIGTVGRLRYEEGLKLDVNILVVDEVDRIFEEDGMRNDFLAIEESLPLEHQTVYFSATLPDKMISLVSDFALIKVDVELSETLSHYFFYVPASLKESALLFLMSKIKAKTIIFTTTKYSVNIIATILQEYNVRAIYSSMDQELRQRNMQDFIQGVSQVLVVTDLAARGLDIPFLDVVINYDICDEKTFLHRVGRVARNGRLGTQYSLVSFRDVFAFFAIRNTYFPSMEIGSIPYEYLLKFDAFLKTLDLNDMRRMCDNANQKTLRFSKKINLEEDYKSEIQDIKTHTYFTKDEKVNARDVLLQGIRSKSGQEKTVTKTEVCEDKYRDQFFIPYKCKSKGLMAASMSVPKDEYEKRPRIAVEGEWQRRKKILFGKEAEKKRV
jgi:ATP-dependent RNA helicase DDX54/DBP10